MCIEVLPRVRVPDSCKGVDVIVGIDEAGRGPVLGEHIAEYII